MLLPDVNVLVYAHRHDAPDHEYYQAWLEQLINGDEAYGLADLVLSGFVRVVTHARVFSPASPLDRALAFAVVLRERPNCVPVAPGPRHWDLFVALCRRAGAKGNLVPDAYLAALAIESGSEWITTDRGFARFPGLRWRHPLDHLAHG
jgi:toxin-antitoxin system PIN domain toxin